MGFRGDRYGLTWGWGGYRSAYIKMGMPMYTTSMIRWVETITRATWFIYVYMELYDWLVSGLEHGFYDFPFSWEFHHPN